MLGEQFEVVERAVVLVRAAGVAFTNVSRGLAPPTVTLTPLARTGAGVYVATLAQGIPSANCRTTANVVGAADVGIVVAHTSDTVKTISTFNQAGAAADADFDVGFAQVV